jgi:hypothetical protein
MNLSRRTMIQSSAAVVALGATNANARAVAAQPGLIIFDSRVAASRAFAADFAAPHIDVATEDLLLWRSLRTVAVSGPVLGLTGWSDWVVVRGLLQEKGKRLKQESKSGTLFLWRMA